MQNIGTDTIYNGRNFSTDACIHYQKFWHVGIHRIIKLQNYVYFYLKCCEVSMQDNCQLFLYRLSAMNRDVVWCRRKVTFTSGQ